MSYRIGVDIGGTFADFCALDEATACNVRWALDTEPRIIAGVVRAAATISQRLGYRRAA